MRILSPAFNNEEAIPKQFTCEDENVNPELRFEEVPEGVTSLALIMDDPDAPNGTFTHWIIWNMDPHLSAIESASVPKGAVEGKNDGGKVGYMGPCPPPGHGPHHYQFKLYALDAMLDLTMDVTREYLDAQISAHKMAEAKLVGTYERT